MICICRIGFLVHNTTTNCIMGCRPISRRLIAIRLRAKPFNITIIQAYAPTTDYSDEEVEDFYEQLQEVLDKTPKTDILVVQGDWNAKVGEDAYQYWEGTCGKYCNTTSSERGLRLLEFASYNNLILANTLGPHKVSRRVTWHSPNGEHHNQIDYIMVKRRFRSTINIAKTRSFPGADIGSDHELVIMTFKLHLKRVKEQGHTRIKFDLEKLKDPTIAEAFQAMIGGKFAALTTLCDDDRDIDMIVNTFNTEVTDTANEILGKHRTVKKPWVTNDVLDLCDKRRELQKKKNVTEAAKEYRVINQEVKKAMKKAKENWIDEQCQSIEDNLKKNNSKKVYQLVKDLTSTKKVRTSTIQDKDGKSLTEDQEILKRWTEYCSELYNYTATGDSGVLQFPTATNKDKYPFLREEVEVAVKSLKKGKSAGVDCIVM